MASLLLFLKRNWIAICLLLCAILLFSIGLFESIAYRSLSANGIITKAHVTEWRQRGNDFQIKYSFAINSKQITRSDSFGRTNLWSDLPKPEWQLSITSKTINVIYDSMNPSNSQPYPLSKGQLFDLSACIIAASISLGLVIYFLRIKRQNTQQVAEPDREHVAQGGE